MYTKYVYLNFNTPKSPKSKNYFLILKKNI
jgi:hypothetical protein